MSRAPPKVRVVIADDSETVRRSLVLLFADEPRIELVGEARDGQEAVRLAARLKPDVLVMDVNLPRTNGLRGLGATEQIMASSPTRVILLCALSESGQLDLTFRAVAAGALEVMARPETEREKPGSPSEGLRKFGRDLARTILLMAEVPVVRRWPSDPLSSEGATAPRHRIDALGIASSTGGPPALASILGALPTELPVAILIAQHIAHGFGDGLIRWLQRSCPLPVKRARDGEPCLPGIVYLAPDGCDLRVDQDRALRTPMSSGPHSPSGDELFFSLAESLGVRAAGIVLSGMGDDGAHGLLALRRKGALCYAQNEESSAVFGMPRAAFELGAVQELMSLDQIARVIVELS